MRLLRLRDEVDPDGVSMELHPNLTVVSGLHGEARCRVLDALAALPGGQAGSALEGIAGLIEAHGILLDLAPETLSLLDLDTDLDNVVGRAELERLERESPDALTAALADPSRSLADARQAEQHARDTHDALARSLETLRNTYRQVMVRRAALELAVAEHREQQRGGGAPQSLPVDAARGSAGAQRPSRASTVVLDGPGPTPEAVAALASCAARVDRLRSKRDETLAALEPLEKIDTGQVEAALAEARTMDRDERVRDPQADALADEFAAASTALDAYDEAVEATGLGPAAAFDRLDEAQRRYLAADEATRPPSIDPADAVALEAAHEELQAAELRLTAARMPSKAIKKRLDDAVAAEQEILARTGFATYTAFVMSTTAPSVSPELKVELEASQVELIQAEAAYGQLRDAYARDPERSGLVDTVDRLRSRAHELVGRVDDIDLVMALRELMVADESHTADADRAARALRTELEVVGVDFGDLELRGDEVADVATVWLADMEEAAARRHELELELRETEVEIARAEVDLSRLETSAPSAMPFERTADREDGEIDGSDVPDLDVLLHDERSASALALLAELEDELTEVAAEEAALEEAVDAQGALVDAAAAGARGASDRRAAIEAAQATDDDLESSWSEPSQRSGLEQVEWYLLAKLASQRSVSYAGAVPLVLDEALSHLPDDEVAHLMDRLSRMTDAVQVIYLGDDPRVVAWAAEAGGDRALSLVLA